MMTGSLLRRLFAEFLGTGLLVTAVVGSGIMASRLSPADAGLQLLENSIATMLALAVLILVFGPVSGAHLNPFVSIVDWWLHRRDDHGLPGRYLGGYVAAQTVGAIGGAVLANTMYGLAAMSWSPHSRGGGPLWLGEAVATGGLILLIFGLARTGRTALAPAAVGAYIGAAYWFTSSTSFANPAVTIGRAFTDTFAGIAPSSVPAFVAAQLIGTVIGAAVLVTLYPRRTTAAKATDTPAGDRAAGEPRARSATTTTAMSLEHGGHDPMSKPSVLFVCVHNAGRSQMAAGWLRHLAGDQVEVRSAGSAPADQVNPVAVRAMAEVGIDIARQNPRILTPADSEASSVVITMGCGDVCPYFPGQRHEDWDLDDPAGQGIDVVRAIRDDIRDRVATLVAEILPAPQ